MELVQNDNSHMKIRPSFVEKKKTFAHRIRAFVLSMIAHANTINNIS